MKALALSCAALLAVSVHTAEAQNIGAKAAAKEKTNVTFSGPVRVPGKVLPAGEYTFQLANPTFAGSADGRDLEEGREKIATFLTVPISRPKDSNELVLMFGRLYREALLSRSPRPHRRKGTTSTVWNAPFVDRRAGVPVYSPREQCR